MKVKTIEVGVQRIINLGNYENVRYECTLTAEIDAGESVAECYEKLANECRANIADEMKRLKKK